LHGKGIQRGNMNEKMLEICLFTGPSDLPVIDFLELRVAIFCYLDEIHPERIETTEKHIDLVGDCD